LALPLEYGHANVQTAVVLHISVEKAQNWPQAVNNRLSRALASADMQEAEPPTIGGRGP
jgi:hypothetical protein